MSSIRFLTRRSSSSVVMRAVAGNGSSLSSIGVAGMGAGTVDGGRGGKPETCLRGTSLGVGGADGVAAGVSFGTGAVASGVTVGAGCSAATGGVGGFSAGLVGAGAGGGGGGVGG